MPHIQTRKLFLVNHKIGKRRCVGGRLISDRRSDHKSLRKDFKRHIVYRPDELPPKVDLRRWMTPVEDQSSINAWYVSTESYKTYKILHQNSEKFTK